MQLDLSRVCITITASAAVGTPKALPPIPKRVQYLNISEYSNDGITDLSALKEFSSLRGLWLDLRTVEQLDLDLLASQKDLRLLEIHCRRLTGIESLASLKQLRSLDLRWSRGVSDVRFAGELVQLRWLNLDRTDVRDLSAVGNLRSLVWLSANASNVSKLPTGPLPSLRTLSLFSAPVSDAEVNAFAASHPNCKVLHRWTKAFHDSVAKVDRIRVRSGGTCHRRVDREKTLLEIQGAAVRDFIAKIEIDESRSGFHCMCCGSPTFEFYEGKRLVAMVGFHHGRSVRWLYGWPGDGLLTPKSADALVNWLADKGVTEPLKERQEALRQRSGNQ